MGERMKTKSLVVAAILVVVPCLLAFPALGAEKASFKATGKKGGFVVGFANPYIGNSWRAQFLEDAKIGADKYKKTGLLKDFIIANSNNDVSQQLQQLNNMIARRVDALMIDPTSAKALGPVIAKAKKANILVVITAEPAAYPGTYAVVHDNDRFARVNTEWLATTLKGKGNIVIITGLVGNPADQVRIDVQKEILAKYPDIKVLASAPANWTPAQAQAVMSTNLSTYPEIDGILQQDVTAPGVVQAYSNAGRTDIPPMVGDSTFGFLRTWAGNPKLNCIAYPMQPAVVIDVLGITLRLLQGRELKDDLLQPNTMDGKLVNTILAEPPYIVTNDAQAQAPWMKGLKYTKSIGVQDAAKFGVGKADAAMLDGAMTDEQIDSMFK